VLDGVALNQDLADGHPPSLDATTDAALKPVFLDFTAWVTDVVGVIGTNAPTNGARPRCATPFRRRRLFQTADLRRSSPSQTASRRATRMVFIRSLASEKFREVRRRQ
jgi:hypothetical protein